MTDTSTAAIVAHARTVSAQVTAAYADTDDHNRRAADHLAASIVPTLTDTVERQAAMMAAVRALHTIDQNGEWTCGSDDCDLCSSGDAHTGPVCAYCTDYYYDDPESGTIAIWPCPTVQILERLTPEFAATSMTVSLRSPDNPTPHPPPVYDAPDLALVYGRAADVPSGIRFRSKNSDDRSWLRTRDGVYRCFRHDTSIVDIWPQPAVDHHGPFVLWQEG